MEVKPGAAAPRYRLLTPPPGGAAGALAAVQLEAEDAAGLEAAMRTLGLAPVKPGCLALRALAGVDEMVSARLDGRTLLLTPHAGVAVLRALGDALERAGVSRAQESCADPRRVYPEASDLVEACALDAIAFAASPLAADVLLRQVEVWRREPPAPMVSAEEAAALARLLRPPTVVAVGPANVGKSTLINALARRAVSVVSEEPGTTRDHVGVTLDCAGLVVRWVDTPGVRDLDHRHGAEVDIEREASALTARVVTSADLVVSCGDLEHGFVDARREWGLEDSRVLRCATRADLGVAGGAGPDAVTAAAAGAGVDALAVAVRERLVRDDVLGAHRRWSFHDALGARGC